MQVSNVVSFGKKTRFAIVAALNHMLQKSGSHDALQARHTHFLL